MNKQFVILGVLSVGVLAALVVAWYFGARIFFGPAQPPTVTGTSTKNFIVLDTTVKHPAYDREVAFSSSLPPEAQKIVNGHIDTLVAQLKKDPYQATVWLDLALQYKTAGDLAAAQEVWEYLTKAAPRHGISFYNLGYHHHISVQDFAKSEQYFKKALEIDPLQEQYYMAFHELYRYSYKRDSSAAVDVLEQGIERLPTSINLRLTLASYYRDDKKDKKSAIRWFTEARDLAKEAGNSELVMSLDKEISALSK